MKRPRLNLNLTGVIVLVAVGVLLPVMLSTAAGIVALVLARDAGGMITGVLVICFAAAAAGSALIAVVLTGRKAHLARRQSDFMANVSHEFRTPLSAIRLYTQTLQSGRLADKPEQTAKCLDTILRETEWLDMMVDSVLTWRASSREKLRLDLKEATVSAAVEGAIARFRSMTEAGEMELETSTRSKLLVLHDAKALNSVVLNLLTNAYKYTGEEKHVSVVVNDHEDAVEISVQDNGVGLSEADAKHIFQAFYRAQHADDSSAGGVGLGLAIARHLIQRHDGSISVDSRKGQGSTFVIRLPATGQST